MMFSARPGDILIHGGKNPGENPFRTTLVAPCGMDCAICSAFLREKNRCTGCATANHPSCRNCSVVTCTERKGRHGHTCGHFPCRRLKQLDARYRAKYRMSMLENLEIIRTKGLREFIRIERERWSCKICGGTIDVHHYRCSACGGVPEEGE